MTARGLWIGLLLAAIVAALAAAPFGLRNYGISVLSMWAVTAIAAIGLNLTVGYAGQVSLAQGAFVGIGAYATAILMAKGVPFAGAFAASGLMCFAIGWLLGYPALRVQHHYLAFVTLAFTTLAFLVFRNEQWLTGGIYGLSGIRRPTILGWNTMPERDYFHFCLLMLVLVTAFVWWIVRSPWGRAFLALRENPVRAASLGVDTRRYTLMAFAIGAGLGGVSGSLYAPLVSYIDPVPFALSLSLNLLLMVIVGGGGYFFGPFVGAAIAVALPEWLRFAQGYYLLGYAVAVMVLLAFWPAGLMGIADRMWRGSGGESASGARR